ncbi:elongin A, like isoform 2-T2 [Menidia menidia]
MASSSDVVKKITRFKLQLSDSTEPAMVLKILQKLKGLDITFEILAETGIGKTVNSLRRHKQAGELAKSLVKDWKRMVPKESTSKIQESSVEAPLKARKADSQEECCEERERKIEIKKYENSHQENHKISQKNILRNKSKIKEDKMDNPVVTRKKINNNTLFGNKNLEGTHQKLVADSSEKLKDERGRFGSERKSNAKSKPSKESSGEDEHSFSSKPSKSLKGADEDWPSEISRSLESKSRKRKEKDKRGDTEKYKQNSKNNQHSKHKKAKIKHKDVGNKSDLEEPSMSFESYLNYDLNGAKKKEQAGGKKTSTKTKTAAKEPPKKDASIKPAMSLAASPEQNHLESFMHLIDVPLPATLPELEKPSSVDYYFERKAEKEPDICDASEESAVFTGQRLNKKMQVYSGAKTLFLPAMMSLYQQCIRALQNNINLLYETGGVPFELLEPVLERCTPEQLLRIEECNPIYIGETDHLWGKHCQREFKDYKLQEYESWKEMYIRLSEEREKKLQRLTKTIVSAHSKKPKGRQVKMAFIHTVAKPPRDVRIQQEIHGTAVQQPHQPKCSGKPQDSQVKSSFNEAVKSSSIGSGGSNSQDPRKKTRVAPMMAKSLKAFKKQLGRR